MLIDFSPMVEIDKDYGRAIIRAPQTTRKYASTLEQIEDNQNKAKVYIPNCYNIIFNDQEEERVVGAKLYDARGNIVPIDKNTIEQSDTPWGYHIYLNYSESLPQMPLSFEYNIKGSFKLYKIIDNEIKELCKFNLPFESDNDIIYIDTSAEQLETVEYKFSQYNIEENGETKELFDAKTTTAEIDFEDILLSDANKILRIRYNPNVSSFKTTVLEQKIDTIGNKFPFFFRNGNVAYKELPLSGLISYQIDDLCQFSAESVLESSRSQTKSNNHFTNQEPKNEFYLERKYKRAVEDWLNNGQPKLLRTDAEGNFIVRLMNVSLTPMEQLSRKIHTFSATAYEMADYNWENLQRYALLENFSNIETSDFYKVTIENGEIQHNQIETIIINSLPISLNYIEGICFNRNILNISEIVFTNSSTTSTVSVVCGGEVYNIEANHTITIPISTYNKENIYIYQLPALEEQENMLTTTIKYFTTKVVELNG